MDSSASRSPRFKVGIIGAGDIVTQVHLPCLLARDDLQIAWVVDSNPDRSRRAGKAFGVESFRVPEDPAALPSADVILLAIPFGARPPYYTALASRRVA